MRKSPGFKVGHWSELLNECPRFCATCIGETIRSCLMSRKPKNHTVLSPEIFRNFTQKDAAVCRNFRQIH